MLIYRELRIANPLINFRTLKDKNFRACCIIIFCAFGVLYANTTTLPALLQTLFGYDATTSGLVLSPAGIFAVMTLFIVGFLLTRGTDARYLMAVGLFTLGIGNYWMSLLNLNRPLAGRLAARGHHRRPVDDFRAAQRRGIPVHSQGTARRRRRAARPAPQRGRQRRHVHRPNHPRAPRAVPYASPQRKRSIRFNPAVTQFFAQGKAFFLQATGDAVASQQMTLQALANSRDQQALSLAYFDVFWASAALAVCLVFLVLLMRRSVAEKGAHVSAE